MRVRLVKPTCSPHGTPPRKTPAISSSVMFPSGEKWAPKWFCFEIYSESHQFCATLYTLNAQIINQLKSWELLFKILMSWWCTTDNMQKSSTFDTFTQSLCPIRQGKRSRHIYSRSAVLREILPSFLSVPIFTNKYRNVSAIHYCAEHASRFLTITSIRSPNNYVSSVPRTDGSFP